MQYQIILNLVRDNQMQWHAVILGKNMYLEFQENETKIF